MIEKNKDLRIKTFETWAPYDYLWTQWAKPVMFATTPERPNVPFIPAKPTWINSLDKKMMIIVDLEAEHGVREGIFYAQLGYPPVPLYNGFPEKQNSILKLESLQNELFASTKWLEECIIEKDAPPVFLLDSRRMDSDSSRNIFDNRWSIFPHDMPSATFLKQQGIEKVVIRAKYIKTDMEHILYRYQKEGLSIYIVREKDGNIDAINIKKPSRFKSLRYRFLVMLKLKRNSTGGFGAYVPDYSEYGHGYYRIG